MDEQHDGLSTGAHCPTGAAAARAAWCRAAGSGWETRPRSSAYNHPRPDIRNQDRRCPRPPESSRTRLKPRELGHAELVPVGEFEAGSYQTFTLTYTCGIFRHRRLRKPARRFPIRGRPDPPAVRRSEGTPTTRRSSPATTRFWNTVTTPRATSGPWDRTLYVKVVRGFMKKGDTITITFGDTSQGSPGMRLQTFCEDTFEFRVLVDPIATYNYQQLPVQPMIKLIPGPVDRWVAVCPTSRNVGDAFRLSIKAEDKWGNPTKSGRPDADFAVIPAGQRPARANPVPGRRIRTSRRRPVGGRAWERRHRAPG